MICYSNQYQWLVYAIVLYNKYFSVHFCFLKKSLLYYMMLSKKFSIYILSSYCYKDTIILCFQKSTASRFFSFFFSYSIRRHDQSLLWFMEYSNNTTYYHDYKHTRTIHTSIFCLVFRILSLYFLLQYNNIFLYYSQSSSDTKYLYCNLCLCIDCKLSDN